MNPTIPNPYIDGFNAILNSQNSKFEIRKSTDLDEEVENNPPVDFGYTIKDQFVILSSILPCHPQIDLGSDDQRPNLEEVKYQLIKYIYIPARGMNPPETIDRELGNFNTLQQALNKIFYLIAEELITQMIMSVGENEMAAQEA